MKSKIFLLAFTVLLMSCEKHSDSYPNANQLILFQVESINNAWGFSHHGILIDSSGNVRHFNYPKNWHSPDSSGYISKDAMKDNIAQLDTPDYTINKDILLKYFYKVEGASSGQLYKPNNIFKFDAGITTFSGFLYDSQSEKYKQVLIRQDGDLIIANDSKEAVELFDWLTRIFYSTHQ